MCLPGDARLQFACVSLQEMLAVMSHTLSGAKEAWGSLDVDARLVWVPRSTTRLSELGLAAPGVRVLRGMGGLSSATPVK